MVDGWMDGRPVMMMERVSDGPLSWLVVVVLVAHAFRCCRPICAWLAVSAACINLLHLHLSSIRLRAMRSLVASRSWAWCFIHFVLVLIPPSG